MPKQGVGPFQFTGSIGEDLNPLFTLNLRLERATQTTELSELVLYGKKRRDLVGAVLHYIYDKFD